jgi:hypothetical protein
MRKNLTLDVVSGERFEREQIRMMDDIREVMEAGCVTRISMPDRGEIKAKPALETSGESLLTHKTEPMIGGIPFSDAISMIGCIRIVDGVPYVMCDGIPEQDEWISQDTTRTMVVSDPSDNTRKNHFINIDGKWHRFSKNIMESRKLHQDQHLERIKFQFADGKWHMATPEDIRRNKKAQAAKKRRRLNPMIGFCKLLTKIGYNVEMIQGLESELKED